MQHILGIGKNEKKFGQCLEPTGVEMGFGAANIQSQKERLMKIVKTESNLRKVRVKVNKNEE